MNKQWFNDWCLLGAQANTINVTILNSQSHFGVHPFWKSHESLLQITLLPSSCSVGLYLVFLICCHRWSAWMVRSQNKVFHPEQSLIWRLTVFDFFVSTFYLKNYFSLFALMLFRAFHTALDPGLSSLNTTLKKKKPSKDRFHTCSLKDVLA